MKRLLKILGIVIGPIGLVIVALVLYGQMRFNSDIGKVQNQPALGIVADTSNVKLGERIATIRNGCIHCHGADLGGFTFIDDPMMGSMSGANITPAKLKDRTDEEIARAIKYGLNRENKSLIFMPSFEYQYLSNSDIASLIAYIRSVPAVEKDSPKISIGPMAKILFGLGKMPNLVAANELIDPSINIQKPAEENTVEFGKYMVNSGCIGCHRMDLTGGTIPGAPPDWPPASALNDLKSKGYTAEKFPQVLRSGVKPDGTNLKLPMVASTARLMTDDELGAIWKYLESAGN